MLNDDTLLKQLRERSWSLRSDAELLWEAVERIERLESELATKHDHAKRLYASLRSLVEFLDGFTRTLSKPCRDELETALQRARDTLVELRAYKNSTPGLLIVKNP